MYILLILYIFKYLFYLLYTYIFDTDEQRHSQCPYLALVIHAAAQRFPDRMEAEFERSWQLNVEATAHLAKVSASSLIIFYYFSWNSHSKLLTSETHFIRTIVKRKLHIFLLIYLN